MLEDVHNFHNSTFFFQSVAFENEDIELSRTSLQIHCSYCTKRLKNEEQLEVHIILKHPDKVPRKTARNEEGKVQILSTESPQQEIVEKNYHHTPLREQNPPAEVTIKRVDPNSPSQIHCKYCTKSFKTEATMKFHLIIEHQVS